MIFDAHSDALFDVINQHHTWLFHYEEMKGYYGAIINYYFKGDESHEEFKEVLAKISNFYTSEFWQYEKEGFFLGIEGLGPLNCLEDVELLKKAHIRSVTLTWNDENLLGVGTYVRSEKGLSSFGKKVLDKLYEYGIVLDLSHANEKTFFEAINYFKGRVFVSHSNVRKIHDDERNLTDAQIMAVKQKKGIIGINAYNKFVGNEKNVNSLIDHIDYLISMVGVDYVCLGLDLDYYLSNVQHTGAIEELSHPSMLKTLIDRLIARKYGAENIEKICYKNMIRFIESSLIM